MSFTPAYERPKIEDVSEGEHYIRIGTADTPKTYWLNGEKIYPAGVSEPGGANCRLEDKILVFVLKEEKNIFIPPGTYLPALVRKPKPKEGYKEPTSIAVGLHVVSVESYEVLFTENGKVKAFASM